MITIDKIEDGLPISVIIPLSKQREDFFYSFTLPLIEANDPMEIIINSAKGSAPKKRNDGFKKSTQPYVFFCDDDILLPANLLETLHKKLESNKDVGYAYSGYWGIVIDTENHPMKNNYHIKSQNFNPDDLKKYNYISTMSLIRRDVFIGFDETLKRFQDWDLYLSLLKKGVVGEFVEDIDFLAFYLDAGLTSRENNIIQGVNKIKNKHAIY